MTAAPPSCSWPSKQWRPGASTAPKSSSHGRCRLRCNFPAAVVAKFSFTVHTLHNGSMPMHPAYQHMPVAAGPVVHLGRCLLLQQREGATATGGRSHLEFHAESTSGQTHRSGLVLRFSSFLQMC